MDERLTDRALLLLKASRLTDLARLGETDYVRWQNIKRGRAQLRANEVELLGHAFPAYRWWLMTGEVMPEMGQTSPDYDRANDGLRHKEG